jgi:hypothetical protein
MGTQLQRGHRAQSRSGAVNWQAQSYLAPIGSIGGSGAGNPRPTPRFPSFFSHPWRKGCGPYYALSRSRSRFIEQPAIPHAVMNLKPPTSGSATAGSERIVVVAKPADLLQRRRATFSPVPARRRVTTLRRVPPGWRYRPQRRDVHPGSDASTSRPIRPICRRGLYGRSGRSRCRQPIHSRT